MMPISQLGGRGPAIERVPMPCAYCGAEVKVYPGARSATCSREECRRLQELEENRQAKLRALEELPEKLPRILKHRGMGPGELLFSRANATPALCELADPWIQELMGQPEDPTGGFGLSGGPGTGKTGLMAVVVKDWALMAGQASINTWGVSLLGKWAPLWVNWEVQLEKMREAFGDGHRAADLLEEMKEAPLLVIEDLGAEQAKEDSWGDTKLYAVLEARLSAGRAILWTSNLNKAGLLARFSSQKRLLSRLVGMAPALECPTGLPDRRFEAAKARWSVGKILPFAGKAMGG